jgi:hypothetical protein
LRFDVDTSVTERMGLEAFALRCLTYKLADGCKEEDLEEKYKKYVSEAYKVRWRAVPARCAGQGMDIKQLYPAEASAEGDVHGAAD